VPTCSPGTGTNLLRSSVRARPAPAAAGFFLANLTYRLLIEDDYSHRDVIAPPLLSYRFAASPLPLRRFSLIAMSSPRIILIAMSSLRRF
jgi:hypothetical protein